MINADGDFGLRGKGAAAEKRSASRAVLFGRDENIGATVTLTSCIRLNVDDSIPKCCAIEILWTRIRHGIFAP